MLSFLFVSLLSTLLLVSAQVTQFFDLDTTLLREYSENYLTQTVYQPGTDDFSLSLVAATTPVAYLGSNGAPAPISTEVSTTSPPESLVAPIAPIAPATSVTPIVTVTASPASPVTVTLVTATPVTVPEVASTLSQGTSVEGSAPTPQSSVEPNIFTVTEYDTVYNVVTVVSDLTTCETTTSVVTSTVTC